MRTLKKLFLVTLAVVGTFACCSDSWKLAMVGILGIGYSIVLTYDWYVGEDSQP